MLAKVKLALKVLLAAFFVLGGINHFRDAPFYLRMMPDYIPAHALMVQLSGVTEIIAGVMLLVPRTSVWGARFIVAHLVVFFTVHVWMVQHPERYSEVPVAGLWFRIVLQFVFIAWAAWFAWFARTRAPSTDAAR
jgi:uncharacterized membrane protein